ncbi:hypothetical protein C0J52_11937 [Blattella germanica]|nr:hypothetical protein C0J52_11937 [Blattella germanica]
MPSAVVLPSFLLVLLLINLVAEKAPAISHQIDPVIRINYSDNFIKPRPQLAYSRYGKVKPSKEAPNVTECNKGSDENEHDFSIFGKTTFASFDSPGHAGFWFDPVIQVSYLTDEVSVWYQIFRQRLASNFRGIVRSGRGLQRSRLQVYRGEDFLTHFLELGWFSLKSYKRSSIVNSPFICGLAVI